MKSAEWLQRFNTPIDLNMIEFLPLITLLKDAKTIIEQQQATCDAAKTTMAIFDAGNEIDALEFDFEPLRDELKRLEDKS